MKKLLPSVILAFFFHSLWGQTTAPAPYCRYQAMFNYNMWEYIKVANQTHPFGAMGSVGNPTTYLYYNNVVFPTLSPGGNVTIEVKPYAVNDLEPIYFALFIDYNQNNIFETAEIVMQNANTTMAALPTFGAQTTPIIKNFTLPASLNGGTYRMRLIREGRATGPYSNTYVVANTCIAPATFGYGNAYDFNLLIGASGGGNTAAPPIAAFAYNAGIDTVWVNSPYAFVNNSTGEDASYWRVSPSLAPANQCVPGYGCYQQIGAARNYRHTFADTGSYLVTLVVRNSSGRDSISKRVYVGYPSRKPKANFFMDKQTIGVSEQIPAYDISEYGPTNWQWTVNPYCRGCLTDPNILPNDFLPTANTQLPVLRARNAGVYDVCLKVWNRVGVDSVCKKDYIEVIGGLSMCASAADTIGTQSSGYVYDNGGPNQPYFPNIMGNCYYTIDPCASSVTAYLEQFKLRNVDTIIFRNGGPTGPVIRRLGGGNLADSMKVITASSGRLYMQWQLGSPQNASVGDSGVVIRWTSVPATYGAPNALFTCPDTVYSSQKVFYTNGTIGQGQLSYTWDTNGDGIYNDYTTGNGANFTFVTLAPLLKDICVRVSNCKGTSTYCKRILVLPVQTRPIANFSSPRPAGFTTDTFRLTDNSRNGPNQWRWVIMPQNVQYVSGTDSSSQHPIFRLTLPGKYTIRLIARNALGVDSVEKVMYMDVLAYNEPFTDFPIANASDIGISRVRFDNVDTTTQLKSPTYHALYGIKRAVLYRGVSYKVDVMRTTGVTPMERKVWIDFNLDADFIDAGEEILSESGGNNLVGSATFMIPNSVAPGRVTRLRVGVSEGGTTLTPDKSRSGCFEDYGIEIGLDDVAPVITLKGSDIHRVQRNTVYQDPGVIAIDNREGDISSRYETSNNINMSQVGVYKARYWVKDLYGNISDTIERIVQVEINQTGPRITLNGPDTVYIEVKRGIYNDLGATAVDYLNQDITSQIKPVGVSSVDVNKIGVYLISYGVKDAFGFISEKIRTVIVRKTYAPTIQSITSNGIARHQVNTPYIDGEGLILRDDYFQLDELYLRPLTGSVNVGVVGSYLMQYAVCDPLNNCSSPFILQVDVGDTIAPVVNLLGPNPLIMDVYGDPTDIYGVKASDNYYSSNSLIRTVDSKVNINKLGTYKIIYTVKDGAGNETIVEREVRVVDRIAPKIEILGGNPFELPRFKDFNDPGIRIIDNYDSEASLKLKVVKTSTLANRNDTLWGDLDGWRNVRYQVTDSSGNVSERVQRNVNVVTITGLNETLVSGQLDVYPNPSNGVFNISKAIQGTALITVYNTLGSKVYEGHTLDQSGQDIGVNLGSVKPGIYLLQLTHEGKQYTQRITIQ